MDNKIDTTCEHIKVRLIAAAVGLQECTKTAANIVPLPGTGRFVVIGAPADVWQLLRKQMPAAESPPTADAVDTVTTLPEDVAALFGACGFEIRSTDPAEKHPLAVCGSLDAAGLVVEKLLVGHTDPEAVPAEFLALLPGVCYMDPPDGGDVPVLEQFWRMAQDAARYRWMRQFAYQAYEMIFDDDGVLKWTSDLDKAIDAGLVVSKATPVGTTCSEGVRHD
jgi:hypothetical protein